MRRKPSGLQTGVGQCSNPNGDVYALFDHVHEPISQAQIDCEFRMACAQARKRRAEYMHADRKWCGYPKNAGRVGAGSHCGLLDILCFPQQTQRAIMQIAALRRKRQRARGTEE